MQFINQHKNAGAAFEAHSDKWLCDLYLLAQQRLETLGVNAVYGGGINHHYCTHRDESQFFSYRREGETGRMGTFIWIDG